MTSEPDIHSLSLEQEFELRIAEARSRLSANDERIARFLREHLDELAFHTAESLAQGAAVSTAAVVRFSRRLGFASFRDLRESARARLQPGQPERPPDAEREPTTFARKVQRDLASIALLPRLLDETLPVAARIVANARTTWFLANRETYGLAVYVHRLLHHTRANVSIVDPSFPDALRDLGPEDAVVAATFRPYSRETLDLIAHSRSAGARIVLLTDGRKRDFVTSTDVVLAVPVESPTLFLSFTPAVCVLEALAALVAMVDADQTYDTLEATARFVAGQRLTTERLGRRRES